MSVPYHLTCTCGQLGYISRKAGRTALRSHPDRRGLRVLECASTGLWHIRPRHDEATGGQVTPISEAHHHAAAHEVLTAAPAPSPTTRAA